MNADIFMFLLADMQFSFVQTVLLIPENITFSLPFFLHYLPNIIFSCTERKWVLTYWLKLQEIPIALR